jgi:hypothetical protein
MSQTFGTELSSDDVFRALLMEHLERLIADGALDTARHMIG